MTTITPEAATAAGYAPVTMAYSKHEDGMLRDAVDTMAGCSIALVAVAHGTEIWRKRSELITDEGRDG